jgi:2-keto-4-pentenoate hydratase
MSAFSIATAVDFLARHLDSRSCGAPEIAGPETRADAYDVQDALLIRLGGGCGWKVGRGKAGPVPYCAPLPSRWKLDDRQEYRPARGTALLEAEIGFRLGADVESRQEDLTPVECHELIDALVPAIEILEARVEGPAGADPLWKLADLQSNGGLVLGDAVAWEGQSVDEVRLVIGTGKLASPDVMRHPFGGPFDLFCWTVNHVARSRGGLRSGDVIITGSYCGIVELPSAAVFQAIFEGIGSVAVNVRE